MNRTGIIGIALLASVAISPTSAIAAIIATDGCLGTSNFSCFGDGEFNNGPLSTTRVEHDGVLMPTSGAYSAPVSGHADIAAGTLSSVGEIDSNPGAPPVSGDDGGVIFGVSSLGDTLTVSSSLAGSFDVTITMTVTGNLSLDGATGGGFATLFAGSETDDRVYSSDGAINDLLSITLSLMDGAVFDVDGFVEYSFDTYPGDSASTNIALNGVLAIFLPDDVTFTSQSEAFLSTPVPVPAILPVFGIALAGLGFIRRRAAA